MKGVLKALLIILLVVTLLVGAVVGFVIYKLSLIDYDDGTLKEVVSTEPVDVEDNTPEETEYQGPGVDTSGLEEMDIRGICENRIVAVLFPYLCERTYVGVNCRNFFGQTVEGNISFA